MDREIAFTISQTADYLCRPLCIYSQSSRFESLLQADKTVLHQVLQQLGPFPIGQQLEL